MINNKNDLKEYIKADQNACGFRRKIIIPWVDIIPKQLLLLRKYEYHLNCFKPGIVKKLILGIDRIRYKKICVYTGISIGPNCFGKGLTIYHTGYIVCNPSVKGGEYITLQCGVNIAENVVIGDNCYLAPGVKVGKNVIIAPNCVIGYNSVVTRNLDRPNSTYIGSPAKWIKEAGYIVDGNRRKL